MIGYEMTESQIAYIQGLIDSDNKVISKGKMMCGKCYPLSDVHIRRIHATTQKEIDRIKNET